MKSIDLRMEPGRQDGSHGDAIYNFIITLPSGKELYLSPLNVEHAWSDVEAKTEAEERLIYYRALLEELKAAL